MIKKHHLTQRMVTNILLNLKIKGLQRKETNDDFEYNA